MVEHVDPYHRYVDPLYYVVAALKVESNQGVWWKDKCARHCRENQGQIQASEEAARVLYYLNHQTCG